MKKILILGVGNAQVDAIAYCKGMGLEVHGCSYMDQGQGKEMVDFFQVMDIKDSNRIMTYVKEKNIDWVYSIGSDIAMPTVSRVSEALGLFHFVSSKSAHICQNKKDMRQCLGQGFKGNVDFLGLKKKEDIKQWHRFPCVIKPVDSQGQRGVFFIKNREELDTYFSQSMAYSRSREVIIEDYIEGPELSANAYIVDETIEYLFLSDRVSFTEYPGGIVKEHVIPSRVMDKTMEKKVYDLVKRVITKLKLTSGPVYLQLKIQDNQPKVIEVTPRLDGCHMWKVIKASTGIDLLALTLQHLIYQHRDFIKIEKVNETRPYQLTFVYDKPGSKFKNEKYPVEKGHDVKWYYNEGEIIQPINGYIEKVGYTLREL